MTTGGGGGSDKKYETRVEQGPYVVQQGDYDGKAEVVQQAGYVDRGGVVQQDSPGDKDWIVQQDGRVDQTEQGGGVYQVDKGGVGKQGEYIGPLPTAGTPTQGPDRGAPPSGSWFSRNSKLVGALVGGVVGGGVGFLLAGPVGALGGAAVGALAGSFLVGRFAGPTGAGDMPLPPPPPIGSWSRE